MTAAVTKTSPLPRLRLFAAIVLVLSLVPGENNCHTARAFAPDHRPTSLPLCRKASPRKTSSSSSSSALMERASNSYYPPGMATTAASAEDSDGDNRRRARYVLERATEFALGDDYDHDDDLLLHGDSSLDYWPIDEARFWLKELVGLTEAGAGGGGVATSTSAVGGDADVEVEVDYSAGGDLGGGATAVPDVVTQLRSKIERHERRTAKRKGAESVVPWIATELSVGALLVVVAIFFTTLDMSQRYDVTPLNINEWVAIMKEQGYLFNLMDYYIFGSGI